MYMFGPLATCALGAIAWALLLRYGMLHAYDALGDSIASALHAVQLPHR